MNGYTVTIAPSGNRSGPQTTIQVDTANGATRVTELTVRAAGNGLSPHELPAIDLALLVAALAPASTAKFTATAAPADAPAARTRQPRRRSTRTAAEVPAATARGRRRAASTAQAPAKTTRGRRRTTTNTAEAPKASRAYRRMPPQDDVLAAWNDSHSASALAAHFDVPRHTAQGWLRRLRSIGVIEPAS
jgi:hypothetical protein